MAAGIATMKALKEGNFYGKHIEELGHYFDEKITQACQNAKLPMDFRRVDAIFWLTPGTDTAPNAPSEITEENAKVYAGLFNHFLEQGIYIAPSAYEVGFLTLSHSKEHIDKLAKAIETYDL